MENEFQAPPVVEDTTLSTYENAKKCPKCGQPGKEGRSFQAPASFPRGTKIVMIVCMSQLCPWFDSPWMVQVNPDGTVPPPKDHTGEKIEYVGFEGHDEEAAQLIMDLKVNEQLKQNGVLDSSINRDPQNPFKR